MGHTSLFWTRVRASLGCRPSLPVASRLKARRIERGAELEGILGYNFLKAFRLSIDYPEATLRLQ